MKTMLIVFVISIVIGFFLWLRIVFEPINEDVSFKKIKERLQNRDDLVFLIIILILCLLITCVIGYFF